jgi:ABC-type multidrug transport system ATPase subunit
VQGEITVNGQIRNEKKFRRQSAYIMQDHEIQPLLTVLEAMYFSASLKIGDEQSRTERKAIVGQKVLRLHLKTYLYFQISD